MKLFSDVLHEKRPHTARAYDQAWRDLGKHLGDMGLIETLTPEQAQAWVDDMSARGLSAATIRTRLSAVSALFEADEDPTAGIARPEAPARQETRIERHELYGLLAAIDRATTHGVQDFALLGSILLTGWSAERVRTLTWADLNLRNGKMYLRDGQEKMQLPRALWNAIAQTVQSAHGSVSLFPGTYLFVTLEGFGYRHPNNTHVTENKPISAQDVNRRVLRYARKAGIDARITSKTLAAAGKTLGREEVFSLLENNRSLEQPIPLAGRNLRTWGRLAAR